MALLDTQLFLFHIRQGAVEMGVLNQLTDYR